MNAGIVAGKCSVDFGVNMHDIGAGTAYDVQSDVGRTENLTCNNLEVLDVVQELCEFIKYQFLGFLIWEFYKFLQNWESKHSEWEFCCCNLNLR